MSEQTANGRNANGRNSRLYEIVIAGLLGLLGVVLTIMFTMMFASIQRLADRMDELDRKVERNSLILVEMQTTLDLIVSGLNIRIEPKEQAGPATAPAPSEKLATKDP